MAGAPEGNQNAVKERRMVTDALRRAAAQNPNKLRNACLKVLENAENGDLAAFKEIADRLDGKPLQSVDVNTKRKSTTDMTDAELVDLIAEARAALRSGPERAREADSGEGVVH